ncbi:MAG: hypothetical protein QOE90_3152 [Thermoplasmata archaeon]|jgi:hypothetical protein|nr:hypothetical protein [Thermoplasmata archaeon]
MGIRSETAAFAAGGLALIGACVLPFTAACLAACGIALSVGEVLVARRALVGA